VTSTLGLIFAFFIFVADFGRCSIQFSLYIAQYHKFASEGFTVCTHTTSLTFDLTSGQEKLPRSRKNPFTGEKKGEILQESNRGGSLFRMDRRIDVM